MALISASAHDALAMIAYDDTPNVLILADGKAAAERAGTAAREAGFRISGVAGLDPNRLEWQAHADLVLVELESDTGPMLDRLLGGLEDAARSGRHPSIIAAPVALIDVVAAAVPHSAIQHLCDPSASERAAALAMAGTGGTARLHDIRRANGDLRQLSEEVGRIAGILAGLSDGEALPRPDKGDRASAADIRAMIRARRLRDQYFGAELFADPAWDMLLDLMAARLERQRVAVSSLCIAAAVPPTTALRWIKALTDHGLFVRQADPEDGRRVYVELSDKAADALDAYLAAARRIAPSLI